MKLRYKLYLMSATFLVAMIMIIFMYFLPSYQKSLMEQREQQLMSTTSQLITMIDGMKQAGQTDDSIVDIITKLRYGTDQREYFFIMKDDGICIKHPILTKLNGTDVSSIKDSKGEPLVQNYLKIALTKGQGSLLYHWTWMDDKTRIEPKMGYVYYYKPMNMIIVATSYLNDVQATMFRFRIASYGIIIGIILLGVLTSSLVINNILKSINKLKQKLQALSVNNIIADNKKETVVTITAIQEVFDSMTQIVTNITSIAAAIEEQSISSMQISKNLLIIDKNMKGMENESDDVTKTTAILEEHTKRVNLFFLEVTNLKAELTKTVEALILIKDQINQTLQRFRM